MNLRSLRSSWMKADDELQQVTMQHIKAVDAWFKAGAHEPLTTLLPTTEQVEQAYSKWRTAFDTYITAKRVGQS